MKSRSVLTTMIVLMSLLAACSGTTPTSTPVPPIIVTATFPPATVASPTVAPPTITPRPVDSTAVLSDTVINANWDLTTPKRTITTQQLIWPCEQVRDLDIPADWNYSYNMYCNISPFIYQREFTPGNWGLEMDVSYTGRPTLDNPRGLGGAITEKAGWRLSVPDITFYPGTCYGAQAIYYDVQISTTDNAPLDFYTYGVIAVNGQPDRFISNVLMPTSMSQLTDGQQSFGTFTVASRTTADFGFQWDIIHPHVIGWFGVDALRVEILPDDACP